MTLLVSSPKRRDRSTTILTGDHDIDRTLRLQVLCVRVWTFRPSRRHVTIRRLWFSRLFATTLRKSKLRSLCDAIVVGWTSITAVMSACAITSPSSWTGTRDILVCGNIRYGSRTGSIGSLRILGDGHHVICLGALQSDRAHLITCFQV